MPVFSPTSIQQFLDYLKFEKRYSQNTLIAYETDLVSFNDFLDKTYGMVGLADISQIHIRSWLAEMKSEGIHSKSLNRKISTLKSFFKFQLKQGLLDKTPMGKIISPKIDRKLPVFMKERETMELVKALNDSAEDWRSQNAKMLITIFYATGMRLSELINLKEKQVDFSNAQVKVLGKGNKERIIPLSQEILVFIKEYQQLKKNKFGEPGEELLITEKGKKLYPRYAWLLVNQYLGEASTLKKKSPHVLRHSFATHLMNNGADLNAVKELLGHSSLAATQVYTHNTIKKLKEVHKKAHPKA